MPTGRVFNSISCSGSNFHKSTSHDETVCSFVAPSTQILSIKNLRDVTIEGDGELEITTQLSVGRDIQNESPIRGWKNMAFSPLHRPVQRCNRTLRSNPHADFIRVRKTGNEYLSAISARRTPPPTHATAPGRNVTVSFVRRCPFKSMGSLKSSTERI
jgi:hypothetical protein